MFSISASVYGIQDKIPINETAKTNPLNPYANSKAMVEDILGGSGKVIIPGKWYP